MRRHEVAVVDGVAALGEPERVAARPSTDARDGRWRGREVAFEDVGGPGEFDLAERRVEAAALVGLRVVRPRGVGAIALRAHYDGRGTYAACIPATSSTTSPRYTAAIPIRCRTVTAWYSLKPGMLRRFQRR